MKIVITVNTNESLDDFKKRNESKRIGTLNFPFHSERVLSNITTVGSIEKLLSELGVYSLPVSPTHIIDITE